VGAFRLSGVSAEDALLHKIALSSRQIDLHQIASLTQFFAPLTEDQAKLLAQAQLKGELKNVTISADMDNKQLSVNGKFNHLSSEPVLTLPAIENLSGSIKGNEQQGKIRLTTDHAQIKYPHLFRNPIPINKLNGILTWQQNVDDWMVTTSMLEVNSPDIQSKSRLQLIIPKTDQPVFMDLQTAFSGKDMSKAGTYYPTTIMSKTLVDWLIMRLLAAKSLKAIYYFTAI